MTPVSPQSSRVVSFTPAPTGQNGLSDLICIVKRFGPPLYTLFLPSRVSSIKPLCLCSVCSLIQLSVERCTLRNTGTVL